MQKFIIKVLLGLLVFGFLVWKAGPTAVVRNLGHFKIFAIVLINITTLCGFLLGGSGVILLGKSISSRVEWRQGMRGFLASSSLAIFVPGRAGDFALPLFWRRYMASGECLAVVFLDKLITLFCILSLGSFGIFVVFHSYMGFIIGLLGIGLIVSALLLFSIPKTRIVVSRILPGKVMEYMQGSVNAFRTITGNGKKRLLAVIVLAIIRILVYGMGFWISLWGVDVTVPILYSILVMTMAQFTSLIPISVMGLGPVEAVCVYSMEQLSISASLVIAALVVGRFVAFFWLSLFFSWFNITGAIDSTENLRSEGKRVR
jgi:uncharacterized membrane protein YbhN (UPF0104 family)